MLRLSHRSRRRRTISKLILISCVASGARFSDRSIVLDQEDEWAIDDAWVKVAAYAAINEMARLHSMSVHWLHATLSSR